MIWQRVLMTMVLIRFKEKWRYYYGGIGYICSIMTLGLLLSTMF